MSSPSDQVRVVRIIAPSTQILTLLVTSNIRGVLGYSFMFDVTQDRYYLSDEIDDRFETFS